MAPGRRSSVVELRRFLKARAPALPYTSAMNAKGTFELTMTAEPPYSVIEGVSLGRVAFEKQFAGPLEATSHVEMIGARTPVDGSAGYVAVERVTGSLEGKSGTFVLMHTGVMTRGARALVVSVVPDSATGELKGLSGTMDIQIVDGKHTYDFAYTFTP